MRTPSGKVVSGLVVHPDREHLIFPLGSSVVVEGIAGKKKQTYLQGHAGNVTCVAVSKSGRCAAAVTSAAANHTNSLDLLSCRFVASGEESAFQATIILWDFQQRKPVHKLTLHKVRAQLAS